MCEAPAGLGLNITFISFDTNLFRLRDHLIFLLQKHQNQEDSYKM